jgi:hypothetical protein
VISLPKTALEHEKGTVFTVSLAKTSPEQDSGAFFRVPISIFKLLGTASMWSPPAEPRKCSIYNKNVVQESLRFQG